jgi:RecB family endonuclease NucS
VSVGRHVSSDVEGHPHDIRNSDHSSRGAVDHDLTVREPPFVRNPGAQPRELPDTSEQARYRGAVRLVIARCSVDYAGRLSAHLPLATRLLLVKADGSVLVHSDSLSYKPLNWMSPPCTLTIEAPDQAQSESGVVELWRVTQAKTADILVIALHEIFHDSAHELGVDPGLIKDGVESDLQRLLAAQIELLGEGYTLMRREYMTAIGPVDIMARDAEGRAVAIELKRRGDIDGVEQLTRYLELLNRDPHLAPVTGVFAAQEIKPQARTLAADRGIRCLTLDYDAMRGLDDSDRRLF